MEKKTIKITPGAKITWEFVEKEEPLKKISFWGRVKKWFSELPIWSRKID